LLREVGKRDAGAHTSFLTEHAARMPRTMLRYAIERLSASQRKAFLALKEDPDAADDAEE
jgi:3-methyladenine DNA glycosylase AlkD